MQRRASSLCWLVPVFLLVAGVVPARAAEPTAEGIEYFEKKIRPLLTENCFRCHSHDGKHKANLFLDSRTSILKGGDNGPALKPGEPEKSLLIQAIRYTGDIKMPKNSKLPDQAIADLTTWVKMGAPWSAEANPAANTAAVKTFDLKERAKHWSLQPLKPGEVPAVKQNDWPHNAVDRYLLAKLEANSLHPAPPADKRTLLRRVTFDLTGLPPTPAEIDAFLADDSPDAYEKVVNQLLDSPHYGERWARHWLDLVRYAETCGHEFDFDLPEAYEYRDYVIRAFNADLPYDQFVTEQIAGDLLPKPRRHPTQHFNESIIGTGFWYLGESVHSPVDVRQNQADHLDNQIDVFGKTFQGMTVACARCHDHKFDAIAAKDYYALTGYLESSRFQRAFIDEPLPTRDIVKRLKETKAERRPLAVVVSAQTLAANLETLPDLTKADPLLKPWLGLAHTDDKPFADKRQALADRMKGEKTRAVAFEAKAIRFEDFDKPTYQDWFVTGEAFGEAPSRFGDMTFRTDERLPVQHVFRTGVAQSGAVSGRLQGALRSRTFRIEKDYVLYRLAGKDVRVNVIIDGYQQIREPIYGGLTFTVNHGDRFSWSVQNVSMWKGHNAYIEFLDDGDGYAAVDRILFADIAAPSEAPNPRLTALLDDPTLDSADKFKDKLHAVLWDVVEQWRSDQLEKQADAVDRLALLNALLTCDLPKSTATPAEQERLMAYQDRIRAIEATIPKPRRAMAMADGTGLNEHIFIRGNHKSLGLEAPRQFLEAIAGPNQPPPAQGSGRLELAKRLLDPSNTLLPRVMVNRLWHHHFGEGIVRSTDDFGVQGQPPTHPELLDCLAAEFVRQGWSIKKMHRMMVLSSVYRMASRSDAKSEEADPQNKLLHRMPVRRLEAECIRDAILAVSGRINLNLYGPSVPPHLTPFMQGRGRPGASGPLDGEGRRSIYINIRRNFLTPMFLDFDYPIPFTTMGRRSVSNVPAQALTLMNNPFVVGEAQRWAKRVLAGNDRTPPQRIERMYVAAFGRSPTEVELKEALAFLEEQAKEYGKADDPRAWCDLCHVFMNLKEFIFVN